MSGPDFFATSAASPGMDRSSPSASRASSGVSQPSARSSLASGLSASSRVRRARMSVEEQAFVEDLEVAGLILEKLSSQSSSSHSNSDAHEARERLWEAEAMERSNGKDGKAHGVSHSRSNRSTPKSSIVTSEGADSRSSKGKQDITSRSVHSGSSRGHSGHKIVSSPSTSQALGSFPASTGPRDIKESKRQNTSLSHHVQRSETSSFSDHAGSASAGGSSGGPGDRTQSSESGTSMTNLEQKVIALQKALATRDGQQTELLARMEGMEEIRQDSLMNIYKELKAAKKAQKDAERTRDDLVDQTAGSTARHASQLARERQRVEDLQAAAAKSSRINEEQKEELVEAQKKAADDKKRQDAQEVHQVAVDEASEMRISSLQDMLASVTLELKESRDSGDATSDKKEQSRLRDELMELMETQHKDRQEMSNMRLEMLGLKRETGQQELEASMGWTSLAQTSLPKAPSGTRGKSRGKGKRGAPLSSIEEEDMDDDLPSIDDRDAWASECVSSDAGDYEDRADPDMVNVFVKTLKSAGWATKDSSAAKTSSDKSQQEGELRKELEVERAALQLIKARAQDDWCSQGAQHKSEIERMEMQLVVSIELHEQNAAELDRLRSSTVSEAYKSALELDSVQVSLRDTEELLRLSRMDAQQSAMKEEKYTVDKEDLEEKLLLAKEALRLASIRLADAKQETVHSSQRHKSEVSDLKLQLAVERQRHRRNAAAAVAAGQLLGGGSGLSGLAGFDLAALEDSGEEDQKEAKEIEYMLRKQLEELKEERNLLSSKLEAKEVQSQIQLDELEMQNAAKLNEIQQRYENRIDDLHEHYKSLISANRSQSGTNTGSEVGVSQAPSTVSTAGADAACWQEILWEVISLIPNSAALMCSLNGLTIQKVSRRASAVLGSDLVGQTFPQLLKDTSFAVTIRRAIMRQQSLADSGGAGMPGFICRELGSFELCNPSGLGMPVNALMTVAHLPAEVVNNKSKGLLVVLSEYQVVRNEFPSHLQMQSGNPAMSVSSDDICPSDSISVGPKRPPPVSLTADERRALRSSFFAFPQSVAGSSHGLSTPAASSQCGSRAASSRSGRSGRFY